MPPQKEDNNEDVVGNVRELARKTNDEIKIKNNTSKSGSTKSPEEDGDVSETKSKTVNKDGEKRGFEIDVQQKGDKILEVFGEKKERIIRNLIKKIRGLINKNLIKVESANSILDYLIEENKGTVQITLDINKERSEPKDKKLFEEIEKDVNELFEKEKVADDQIERRLSVDLEKDIMTVEMVEELLDQATNQDWLSDEQKQIILEALKQKNIDDALDVLDEIRDSDIDVSQIEGVSSADYWEKPVSDKRKRTPDIRRGDLAIVTPKNRFLDKTLIPAINKIFKEKKPAQVFLDRELKDAIEREPIEITGTKENIRRQKERISILTNNPVTNGWIEATDRTSYLTALLDGEYDQVIKEAEKLAEKFPEQEDRDRFTSRIKTEIDYIKEQEQKLKDLLEKESDSGDEEPESIKGKEKRELTKGERTQKKQIRRWSNQNKKNGWYGDDIHREILEKNKEGDYERIEVLLEEHLKEDNNRNKSKKRRDMIRVLDELIQLRDRS